jgi:hypothetical protein
VGATEQRGLQVGADHERSPQVGDEQLEAVHHRRHVLFRAEEAAEHRQGGLDVGSTGLQTGQICVGQALLNITLPGECSRCSRPFRLQ